MRIGHVEIRRNAGFDLGRDPAIEVALRDVKNGQQRCHLGRIARDHLVALGLDGLGGNAIGLTAGLASATSLGVLMGARAVTCRTPHHEVDRAQDRDDVGDHDARQDVLEHLQVDERRRAHLEAPRCRAALRADVIAVLALRVLDVALDLADFGVSISPVTSMNWWISCSMPVRTSYFSGKHELGLVGEDPAPAGILSIAWTTMRAALAHLGSRRHEVAVVGVTRAPPPGTSKSYCS